MSKDAKNKKSDLKIVSATKDEAAPVAKKEAKVSFCKEFECTEKSQVSGYCRLHFLKLVKKSSAAAHAKAEDKEEKEEKSLSRWDRRKGGRISGFEPSEEIHTAARAEIIDQLGSLDGELTSILDGEDLDPFKKTG